MLEDDWAATIGCVREPTNVYDRCAVAIVKDGQIIGHLPHKLSKIRLRRGGTIVCTVIGYRRYSSDLPQGGLEIPCTLILKLSQKKSLNLM